MAEDGPTPVVFVHGLWMHATSWDPWVQLFTERGYAPLAPGWPGDAATVAETRADAAAQANHGIAEITDHYAEVIQGLPSPPVVIGHSFGGLIAERLVAQGVTRGGVAISPAQFRGILGLPLAQLESAWPFLSHPGNRTKAISHTPDSFHKGFANAIPREESDALYDSFAIPGPGLPLFQAASANLFPHSQASVDTHAERGPLLIIGAGKDRTVPEATSHAAFKRYKSASVTEWAVFPDRGHSLTIDHGWREVADKALNFLNAHGL